MRIDRLAPVTIFIAHGRSRRVTKVALLIPFRDGGLALSVPFHPSPSTLITKNQWADDRIGDFVMHSGDDTARFTSSHRVKLSYHANGFVQISGAGLEPIISGTYHGLAIPKAFGIYAHPLWAPVWTGPSFGLGVWGLDDYPLFDPDDAALRPFLVLTPEDVFSPASAAEPTNGFQAEFWVFPRRDIVNVVSVRGRPMIFPIEPFMGQPMSVPLRVIDWGTPHAFLGVLHFPVRFDFGPLPSGYALASPRDATGHSLHTVTPAPPWAASLPSIDYVPGARVRPLGTGAAGSGIIIPPTRTVSEHRARLWVPGNFERSDSVE